MKHAVCLANFGTYADPHATLRVARVAADAGWDGLFVWDHLAFVWNGPSADPWVTLAAVAAAVPGLTLGTAITPLPRRRPQVVAEQAATLERLNGGSVILGVGLGGNRAEFERFGEDFDEHRRARLLDDGLELVRELWDGPIWVGGNSRAARARASRFDGWIPNSADPRKEAMPAAELAAKVATLERRGDVAYTGNSEPGGSVHAYAEAGATWWFENVHDLRGTLDDTLARVGAGPPVG